MDTAPDVYFRLTLTPARGFAYVSRGVQQLTGHAAQEFQTNPALCASLVPREDRRMLARMVRARRSLSALLRVQRPDGALVPLEVRTVPVIRAHRLVAVEGVATVLGRRSTDGRSSDRFEPMQPRLAALLYDVRALLHQALLPKTDDSRPQVQPPTAATLRTGAISLDTHRMTAALDGEPVALTSRELLVLQYFLRRPGRIVTRAHLLEEVWGYRYTGDARTVDVHVSRLRRKLPPLRGMLCAIRHIGYRLDPPERIAPPARCIANI